MKKYRALLILSSIMCGCNANTINPEVFGLEVTIGKPSDIYGIMAVHYTMMYDQFKQELETLRGEEFNVDVNLHKDTLSMLAELVRDKPHVLVLKEQTTGRIFGFLTYDYEDRVVVLRHCIASDGVRLSMLFDEVEACAVRNSACAVQVSAIQRSGGHPYFQFYEKRGYIKGDRDHRYAEERYFYIKNLT